MSIPKHSPWHCWKCVEAGRDESQCDHCQHGAYLGGQCEKCMVSAGENPTVASQECLGVSTVAGPTHCTGCATRMSKENPKAPAMTADLDEHIGRIIAILIPRVFFHDKLRDGAVQELRDCITAYSAAQGARIAELERDRQVVCTKCGYIAIDQSLRDFSAKIRADTTERQARLSALGEENARLKETLGGELLKALSSPSIMASAAFGEVVRQIRAELSLERGESVVEAVAALRAKEASKANE